VRRAPQPHRPREKRPAERPPAGEPGAIQGFKRLTADAARDAACAFIAQHAAKFPQLDLAPLDESELGLEGRDAAFAHAVVDAVLRRWLTLRHLIQTRLTQPFETVEAPLQAALLVGAAQVVLLDRVPAYAAIDHAVEWSKRRVRPGAGGMANAVLRKVAALAGAGVEPRPRSEGYTDRPDELPLPDGSAIRLTEPVMGEDPLDRLACATGHPRALVEVWAKAHGQGAARSLALHGVMHAPTIVRVQGANGAAAPTLDPGLFTPHDRPGFAVFTGSRAALVEWLGQHHECWVQDPASTLAVESVADLRPRVIVDACAGQGTKTRQLARTFPEAQIIATDTDDARRKTLAAVFEGHPRVRVVRHERLIQHAGQADLVLLDVPCSNTGVLARRPEAKYRFVKNQIEELEGIQRQILADAIPLLSDDGPGLASGGKGGKAGKGGGLILYSTCSLQPTENAGHIAWARKWHDFVPSRERTTLPRGMPGGPARAYQDGSYSVVLGRWGLG
jgi:16S rRNA (cytosine967-C5)-methyltransferase